MKYLTHPIAVYAAKVLVYAAISAGVFVLMNKYYRISNEAPVPVDDSTKLKQLELTIHINDSTLQTIKTDVDSILFQTQTNEATLKRIRAGRSNANSSISTMSSADLTRSLTERYADSIR